MVFESKKKTLKDQFVHMTMCVVECIRLGNVPNCKFANRTQVIRFRKHSFSSADFPEISIGLFVDSLRKLIDFSWKIPRGSA